MFPHFKRESLSHGGSPGNGITPMAMSREPLATEGEATPGPDDVNPYDEREFQEAMRVRNPTEGEDDPYTFDDIGDGLESLGGGIDFPTLNDSPETGGFL